MAVVAALGGGGAEGAWAVKLLTCQLFFLCGGSSAWLERSGAEPRVRLITGKSRVQIPAAAPSFSGDEGVGTLWIGDSRLEG